MSHSRRITSWCLAFALVLSMFAPAFTLGCDPLGAGVAWAAEQSDNATLTTTTAVDTDDSYEVVVSSTNDAAAIDGVDFALSSFERFQKGSNRSFDIDGASVYCGYSYNIATESGHLSYVAQKDYVVVYVPKTVADEYGIDSVGNGKGREQLIALVRQLDDKNADGGVSVSENAVWYLTTDTVYTVDKLQYRFDQELKAGQYYATVIGADGSDITDSDNPLFAKPTHAGVAKVEAAADVHLTTAKTGLDAFVEFVTTLNWSPLWVTLKTTLTAIVFIFILGLAAAYFTLHIPKRAQDVFDSIFTIPMVLPPTVCGFVLLYACGSKTPFGQFFIDIGFPLIFSWPATVIAATIVAFPLMYRNARGAFENLDPNMLDAARTLGWSNRKIFFKLMLPLSWSSIAAATVLAFARALGEFGATLFLAGNYLGVTRTIPIAIYFEWMNGNDEIAWFWTAIILIFSFIVILFINLWSGHTTKYRKKEVK